MSRFAVIYEDPSYEYDDNDEGDWQDVYVEPGAVKSFEEWTPEAQARLIQDIFSPHATINS